MVNMKTFIFVLCLGLTVGRTLKRQDAECINDDPICDKYDNEELDIYCNDASTGVGEGCCLACQGHVGEHEDKRDECTNGDDVCEKYTDSDLEAYCADDSTGVPEVCCAACAAHAAKRSMPMTFMQMRQEAECINDVDICEQYDNEELDIYCNDVSTRVGEVCCLACQGHVGEHEDKRQEAECVNSDPVCEKYGDTSLDIYCNDNTTGVAEACCLACQGHVGDHEHKRDDEDYEGEEYEEYDEEYDTHWDNCEINNGDSLEEFEKCLDEYWANYDYNTERPELEKKDECINDDPICDKYDNEELDIYCNDASTGVGEGCCLACQGHVGEHED